MKLQLFYVFFIGMKCGRNKATPIIKEMASSARENLIARMKSGPYSISTDGSNDSESKQYPIVVRTFNPDTSEVTSELLNLAICHGPATGCFVLQFYLFILLTFDFSTFCLHKQNSMTLFFLCLHLTDRFGFLRLFWSFHIFLWTKGAVT